MGRRRILILAHVGTSLGHLIRVGEVIESLFSDWEEVLVAIPSYAIEAARKHLPSTATICTHDIKASITSPDGKLDLGQFVKLVGAYREIAIRTSPDFILGDPGLCAGLIGDELGVPWGSVTHAPYNGFPNVLRGTRNEAFAVKVWATVNAALDVLVRHGSAGKWQSWSDLRSTSYDEIEALPRGVFSSNRGTFKLRGVKRLGWISGPPFPCIVALSSGDTMSLPRSVTDGLANRYGQVGVVGPVAPSANTRVEYLGCTHDIRSLVSETTVVITHGGSGTLQHVHHAKEIVVVPGDLDQMCNGLVYEARGVARLIGLKTWKARLEGDAPFVRNVPWQEYIETELNECVV